jgi:SOS regulatory protein LexA
MPRLINLDDKIAKLRMFLRREQRLPGYREMLDLFDYNSKNAVHGLLLKLVEHGFLIKDKRGEIAPTDRLSGSIRLLGAVQAGFPSPAEEELVDVLSLDEFLVKRPEATFLLTVSGDSMIDAGIQPGDYVLVERGRTPKSGAIVVAQVDGEWTLKYYIKDRTGVHLDPANKKYKSIRPENQMIIGGVVCGVLRKYE